MNNGFSITVVFSLLLCAWLAATSEVQVNEQTTDPEVDSLFPRGRDLKQAEFNDDFSPPAPTRITECADAILGADLTIHEGRVVRRGTASTITVCCEACQATQSCTSWRRNRSTGYCELISATQASFTRLPDSAFDIGGFLGDELLADYDAGSGPRPLVECRLNRGVVYTNGNVLTRGSTQSSFTCCETCRFSRDCFSWYYNNSNRRCILNRNRASARSAPSRFEGGSF